MTKCGNLELIRRIVQLENVASKDETRFHINGVFVEVGKEMRDECLTVNITATDGHCLASEEWEVEGLDLSFAGESFIVNRDSIKLLKPFLSQWKKIKSIPMTLDRQKQVIFMGANEFSLRVDSQGHYPKWRQLLPKENDFDAEIGLNPELLMLLAKAAKENNQFEPVKIRIKFTGALKTKTGSLAKPFKTLNPYSIKTKSDNKTLVLMPTRV